MNLASCFISNLHHFHLLSKEMPLEGANGMKLTQGPSAVPCCHYAGTFPER